MRVRAAAVALAAALALAPTALAQPAPPAGSVEQPTDLRALMRPAAVLESSSFTHRMALAVRASPDGVSRLRLAPEVLAAARPDLGDLRVVDGDARQWPYVIKEGAARQLVDVPLGPPRTEQGSSRYAVALPARPAQIDELQIRVDREYLDRPYRLVGKTEGGGERALANGRITRRVGGPAQVALPVPPERLSELALVVDDGDEAPLPLTTARVAITVPDLLLLAPSGEYALLVGDPEAGPPRYELARAREAILAVNAGTADPGPLGANPAHHAPDPGNKGAYEQYALWGALGLAVVVLAGLALRLARREGTAPASRGPDTRPRP